MRGGALHLGHRRLPIAHNETALSAGSGAEGKHGRGAQPGQKEAEVVSVSSLFSPRPSQIHLWDGSPVGSQVCRVDGGPGQGVTLAPSSSGLFAPIARTREPPVQRGLSSWVRVRIFTLCQTLRGQKKGFAWGPLAPALQPAEGDLGTPGRSFPASWSPRWLRGQEYGDASSFSASSRPRKMKTEADLGWSDQMGIEKGKLLFVTNPSLFGVEE